MATRIAFIALTALALQAGCKCECESTFAVMFDTTLTEYSAELTVDGELLEYEYAGGVATAVASDVNLISADGTGFVLGGEPAAIEATIIGTDPTWTATGVWAPTWDPEAADSCDCIDAQAQLSAN